jgi:hypothetical protein
MCIAALVRWLADVNAFSAGELVQPMKAAEDHQGALDASLLQINGILHQARVTQEVTHHHVNMSAIQDGLLSLAHVCKAGPKRLDGSDR